MDDKKIPRSHCWFLEINPKSLENLVAKGKLNPSEIEDPEKLAQALQSIWEKSGDKRTAAVAICLSADGLYHAHLALYDSKNAPLRTVVSNTFGKAHAEPQHGTKEQVKAYLEKSGKFNEKGEVVLHTLGLDKLQDARKTSKAAPNASGGYYEELYALIKAGKSDAEILAINPTYMRELGTIARLRDILRPVENYRNVTVTYLYGTTGTGKTRYVRDNPEMPPDTIYCANGNHPFDGYNGQDVVFFDEFRADYPLKDMLRYLDNYSTTLSARYHDKQAAYTKVFLASNWTLEKQYDYEKVDDAATYQAFLRRINEILWFRGDSLNEHRETIEKWYVSARDSPEAVAWYNGIDWTRGIIRYSSVEQYQSRNVVSGIINQGKPFVSTNLPPALSNFK